MQSNIALKHEDRNKRIGIIVSVILHVLILLLCYFLLVWSPPDPPLPSYGIEVNLGNVDAGSGNNQQPDPQPNPVEDPSEEDASEANESMEDMAETNEESADEPSEQPVETYDNADNTNIQESVKPSNDKPIEKAEEKKPKENTSPKENTNNAKAKAQNNNGDKENATGDQGNPDGKINQDALYGNPGKGGSSLDMSGWMWDFKPSPKDESDESGRIVFKVTIDDEGEILQIRAIEKTVSPSIVKIYENEVRKLTFSKTRDNASTAPTSTGKITFIIRSN